MGTWEKVRVKWTGHWEEPSRHRAQADGRGEQGMHEASRVGTGGPGHQSSEAPGRCRPQGALGGADTPHPDTSAGHVQGPRDTLGARQAKQGPLWPTAPPGPPACLGLGVGRVFT